MTETRAACGKLRAALAALALLCASPRALQAGVKLSGAGAAIPRNGQSAGGQPASSASFKLNSVVGDSSIGAYAGGSVRFQSGLAAMEAQPGSVTSLTAVTKTTGTLTLAWNAPGLDGAQGDPLSGYWRLDYSSDPAHVFAPTTFQQEWATSTTAGAAQSVELTGLLPDTTYYAKVYLADASKYFAEDSSRDDDSTLANAPVNPAFSDVEASSVTISWLLPTGGAGGGYEGLSSLSNFGGTVSSSATPNGLLLSLTLNGLNPGTTYFFKVASLNWQGEKTYSVVLSTVTPLSTLPLPVTNLAAAGNGLTRSVAVTWNNPSFRNMQAVLVVVSTSAAAPPIADYTSYAPGQTLADGSIVESTAIASAYDQSGLTLDTTYFYHVRTQGGGPLYSVDVSTTLFLDLPPMGAAGLTAQADAAHTVLTLRWSSVISNVDGSLFATPSSPRPFELSRYELYRSTGILHPSWVLVSTHPASTVELAAAIPDPNSVYFYKVVAVDSLGTSDQAMAADTDGNLYALDSDGVTRLEIPAALTRELTASGSKTGTDVLVRSVDKPGDVSKGVFRSVDFAAVKSPTDGAIEPLQLSQPALVTVHYDTLNGMVSTTSVLGAAVSDITAYNASDRLGLYWYNDQNYIKLYGSVDTLNQTLTVQSGFGGSYQIRGLVRDQAFTFDVSNISNRAITPNGDHLNDVVVFNGDNPRDSEVTGKIYDIHGAFVSDMTQGPVGGPGTGTWSLEWDARSFGQVVRGGVYIYEIRAEGKSHTGTVVVIR